MGEVPAPWFAKGNYILQKSKCTVWEITGREYRNGKMPDDHFLMLSLRDVSTGDPVSWYVSTPNTSMKSFALCTKDGFAEDV